jgi:hypothetical protein
MVRRLMNGELKGLWKEAAVTYFKVSAWHSLRGNEKNRISSLTEYQRSLNANFVFLVLLTLLCPSYFKICVRSVIRSEPRKKISKNLTAFNPLPTTMRTVTTARFARGSVLKRQQARICNYLYCLYPAVYLYQRDT